MEVGVPMNGLRGCGCEKGLGGPWLAWRSAEKFRERVSEGETVVDRGRYGCEADTGADGGGPGYDSGCSDPRASCIDGSDCRVGRCCSFSSPDVRRDSGGESKPPSVPGSVLAPDDW